MNTPNRYAAAVAVAAAVLMGSFPALAAQPPQQPIPVSIGGGAVDSAAFRWSSALAEILSRPPGLPACEPTAPCGVPGVVAGAQTYDQPTALLKALSDGRLATGIVPAMYLFEAHCATPKEATAATPITILKTLYRQPVQLVVRADQKIDSPKDLIGKTLAVGEKGSESEAIAYALLTAYGVPRAKVNFLRLSVPLEVAALSTGSASAAVFIGHAYDTPIGKVIGTGKFTLMSLADTPQRQKLLQSLPVYSVDAFPEGFYPGLQAVSTIAQPVVWAAGPTLEPSVAERLVASISEPRNQTRLAGLVAPVTAVADGEAFMRLPAPIDEGGKLYADSAKLPISQLDCPK